MGKYFNNPSSEFTWDLKYKYKDLSGNKSDKTIEDTWKRVAKGLSQNEKDQAFWESQFYSILKNCKVLPGGRILSNAGTDRQGTSLINCVVSDTIPDSISGIFDKLKEAAQTLQTGSGIGYDFSSIRPKGMQVHKVQAEASGPLSFMQVFDQMCKTIMSAGLRRGAQLGALRVDHPDIEDFITIKLRNAKIDKFKALCREYNLPEDSCEEILGSIDNTKVGFIEDAKILTQFNISVAITDEFMEAVRDNKDFDLKFKNQVFKTIKARDLFNKITELTYECNDPGVLYIDTVNKMNNLWYCEQIATTNPCGEQTLPPYGNCLLTSINVTQYVENPFEDNAKINFDQLEKDIPVAVRMMDNVIDITYMPLDQQIQEMKSKRRIGLGITGLGDLFAMMKIRYGSSESVSLADKLMGLINKAAYKASIELAKERGPFPLYDAEKYTQSKFIQKHHQDLIPDLLKYGIRNSHLLSVQPTGTISQIANQVSSGLEPIFLKEYERFIRLDDGSSKKKVAVVDYAWQMYKDKVGYKTGDKIPEYFADVDTLSVDDHLNIQIAIANHLDAACSKTINVPNNYSFEDFQKVYMRAWESGVIKGTTTYRAGTGASVFVKPEEKKVDPPPKKTNKPFKRKMRNPSETYKIKTPKGNLYPTIVEQDGEPVEVFINAGKQSQEILDWCIALGRMCSLYLQDTKIEDKDEALRIIANNLKDINGEEICWLGRHVVKSVPDALSLAFEDYLGDASLDGKKKESDQNIKQKKIKCKNCKSEIDFEPGCNNPPCPECGYEGKCG
jgi:ribonucleoside-diphosphate reductase alpha chain